MMFTNFQVKTICKKIIKREKVELMAILVGILMLFTIITVSENSNIKQIYNAAKSTVLTLSDVAVALCLFISIVAIMGLISAFIAERVGLRKVSVLWSAIFVGLIYFNAYPIVYFIDWLKYAEISSILPPSIIRSMSLVTSNAMLYFFFYMFIVELNSESKKLYVVSARFKSESPVQYLKERAIWIVYGSIGSLLYYLLSFHLFVDIQNQSNTRLKVDGIIGTLYTSALNGRMSVEVLLYFFSMLIIVLLVKIIIDVLLYNFELKNNLSDNL